MALNNTTLGTHLQRWVRKPWLIILAVIMVGVVTLWAMGSGEPEDESPAAPRPAVPVEVVAVREATLEETVRGIGTLRAPAVVEIQPEIGGIIRAIHFQEGGPVEEGELLIEIDDNKLRRQLAARQAALRTTEVRERNARQTFERQRQLRERGLISQDEFDRARAELDSALAERERLEAEVELMQEELGDTRIVAPFDGVISERQVNRGAYVASGDTLATLYRIDPLEIAFSVTERYMGRVRHGQSVQVTVAVFPGRSFEGEVDFVSPAIRETTRDFLVKATLENPDGLLKPGAFATALLTVGVREQRPVIPEEALVATRRGYMVFTVEDEIARLREVQTGLRRDGMVEILEGLDIGEQVVRTGHLRLSDGGRVRVQDEQLGHSPAGEARP